MTVRFAVVIVSWNGEPWIRECLESSCSQNECRAVVIVDNASEDETLKEIASFSADLDDPDLEVRTLELKTNLGFTRGANRGIEAALELEPAPQAILLLNQDATLEDGCLAAFARSVEWHPRGGAFGPKILFPDKDVIQHAGGLIDEIRLTGDHLGHHQPDDDTSFDQESEVDYVTGAAMVLRTSALREVGSLDEVFSPGYYEDVEVCDRLRSAGWTVWYVPAARARHHESASFGSGISRLRLAHRNRLVYALPRLVDPTFSDRFLSAERQYLSERAAQEEIRAIASASVWVMAHLRDLLARRRKESVPDSKSLNTIQVVLESIRECCATSLERRIDHPSPRL
jgi:GT2 family glycosyltransferase